jgi:hypothetical protein
LAAGVVRDRATPSVSPTAEAMRPSTNASPLSWASGHPARLICRRAPASMPSQSAMSSARIMYDALAHSRRTRM